MNNLRNRGVEDILIAVVPSRQICFTNRLPVNGKAKVSQRAEQNVATFGLA